MSTADATVMPGQDELNDPSDVSLFLLGRDYERAPLPPARAEAIPVAGHRSGPAGDLGYVR